MQPYRGGPGFESFERFALFPDWLIAAGRGDRVRAALERHIPEPAPGRLAIEDLRIARVRLKKAEEGWAGQYEAIIAGEPGGAPRTVTLKGRLAAPGTPEPMQGDPNIGFGAEGWRCYIPELRLELKTDRRHEELPALAILADSGQARALLERSIREGSPAYREFRVRSCAIKAVRYKAGSRATVVYELGYAPEDAGRDWPPLVVAKTYRGSMGRNTYAGMRALWDSPFGAAGAVRVAEPLAYIPDLKVLVQGPVPGETTLEDLLNAAVRSGTRKSAEEFDNALGTTARGLAALHRCGVRFGRTYAWEDALREVREAAAQIGAAVPAIRGAATPLLAHVEDWAAAHPADPALPSHGAFRPAQVLLDRGQAGFIDFDGFGQAEPAFDLSRFLRKSRALVQEPTRADSICERFLAAYERNAPVSRMRVALWETLDLIMQVLYCWTKIEPERVQTNLSLLERHLRITGMLPG